MSIKYVITFSNCTNNGVVEPEKLYNKSVIEYVTGIIAKAAKNCGYDLDNCTAYPVNGMYKGNSESSYRLEYIVSEPIDGAIMGFALWIKYAYSQESILLETYNNGGYKAELIYAFDREVEL